MHIHAEDGSVCQCPCSWRGVPILLSAPKYLNGTMTLGEVMQAASAFTIVQTTFNWLVDKYPRLSDWTASVREFQLVG